MTTPPQSGRGQPAFDQAAQEAILAARGQGRRPVPPPDWENPPGYERAELTDEERAEAEKAKRELERVCRLCGAVHVLPNSAACPRLASFELDPDGRVKAGTFHPGRKWADGRAVFYEDTQEEPEKGK